MHFFSATRRLTGQRRSRYPGALSFRQFKSIVSSYPLLY